MPFVQTEEMIKGWTPEKNRVLGEKIKAARGRKPIQKTEKWLHENINMPLYERGFPWLGAVLSGLGTSFAELSIPQGEEDFSAIPFGKFTKGASNQLMSNEVGLLNPIAREQALQRQNAVQAVREAIQKHKTRQQSLKEGLKTGKYPDTNQGYVGAGSDVGAYDADGVIVKSPRFSPFQEDYYDKVDAKKRRLIKTHENVQRLDPEQAKIVADRDIESARRQHRTDALQRFVMDQDLEYAGLAPDTFMVQPKNKIPYIVQEKADKLLAHENMSTQDRVAKDLARRVSEDTALSYSDLTGPNVGLYGDKYKIIDSGNFEGVDPNEAIDEAKSSWRFIEWLKGSR